MIQGHYLGRTHGAPQAVATSGQPLPPQARPTFHTPPSPWTERARALESAAPLTPSCLSEEEMPSGDLHAEAGTNPKLKTRSCANKEEKEESLPVASGAAD